MTLRQEIEDIVGIITDKDKEVYTSMIMRKIEDRITSCKTISEFKEILK